MSRLLRVLVVVSMIPMVLACSRSKEAGDRSAEVTAAKKEVVKQTVPASCDNLVPPAISQFPAGFDYPQSATTLKGWVVPGGGDRMRYHAYCVFAGLNQLTNATPTWRTWGTSTQAFPFQYNPWQKSATEGAGEQAPRPSTLNAKNFANAAVAVGGINNPAPIYDAGAVPVIRDNPRYKPCLQRVPNTNYQTLKDGVNFESNGDIMVATVSYNKAALDNITRVSALELGGYGIRVNSVNPTVVMTPMSAWYWGRPDIEGPFLEAMPLHKWATEDDIAAPIVFLLGDGAGMISGVSLPIDGGYSSR